MGEKEEEREGKGRSRRPYAGLQEVERDQGVRRDEIDESPTGAHTSSVTVGTASSSWSCSCFPSSFSPLSLLLVLSSSFSSLTTLTYTHCTLPSPSLPSHLPSSPLTPLLISLPPPQSPSSSRTMSTDLAPAVPAIEPTPVVKTPVESAPVVESEPSVSTEAPLESTTPPPAATTAEEEHKEEHHKEKKRPFASLTNKLFHKVRPLSPPLPPFHPSDVSSRSAASATASQGSRGVGWRGAQAHAQSSANEDPFHAPNTHLLFVASRSSSSINFVRNATTATRDKGSLSATSSPRRSRGLRRRATSAGVLLVVDVRLFDDVGDRLHFGRMQPPSPSCARDLADFLTVCRALLRPSTPIRSPRRP